MKKFKNFSFFLFFSFIVFSCNKKEIISPFDLNNDPKLNEASWIFGGEYSKGSWLNLKFFIGHTAEQCGNKCLMIFGQNYHADCRGFGNICNYNFSAEIFEYLYNEFILVLWDIDELEELEIFSLPDRSLYITNPQNNSDLWLNIPEQILVKDSTLMQFVIQNIWFSDEPELENE